jgi:hypothetical protein
MNLYNYADGTLIYSNHMLQCDSLLPNFSAYGYGGSSERRIEESF